MPTRESPTTTFPSNQPKSIDHPSAGPQGSADFLPYMSKHTVHPKVMQSIDLQLTVR
jgi:hypothetical protein